MVYLPPTHPPTQVYVCTVAHSNRLCSHPPTHPPTHPNRLLANNGQETFPPDTRLVFAYGHALDGPMDGVLVGAVEPGAQFSVSLPLTSPAEPNQYIGCWQLEGTGPRGVRVHPPTHPPTHPPIPQQTHPNPPFSPTLHPPNTLTHLPNPPAHPPTHSTGTCDDRPAGLD